MEIFYEKEEEHVTFTFKLTCWDGTRLWSRYYRNLKFQTMDCRKNPPLGSQRALDILESVWTDIFSMAGTTWGCAAVRCAKHVTVDSGGVLSMGRVLLEDDEGVNGLVLSTVVRPLCESCGKCVMYPAVHVGET